MKYTILIICAIVLLSCKNEKQEIKKEEYQSMVDSIITGFGKPIKYDSSGRHIRITYKPTKNDFFLMSDRAKELIDKSINMLPSLVKERQSYNRVFYDHYEWEKPKYKITLENTVLSLDNEDFKIDIIVEKK